MLKLSERRSDDAAVTDALGEVRRRVEGIALWHRALQVSGDGESVQDGPFLGDLALDRSLGTRASRSSTNCRRRHRDRLGRAQAIAVVLGEAVTNAVKHGFDGRRCGALHVGLDTLDDERLRLTVRELVAGEPSIAASVSGTIRAPSDERDRSRGFGLGRLLMQSAAERVGGALDIGRDVAGGASSAGSPIGPLDVLIAGQAVSRGRTW